MVKSLPRNLQLFVVSPIAGQETVTLGDLMDAITAAVSGSATAASAVDESAIAAQVETLVMGQIQGLVASQVPALADTIKAAVIADLGHALAPAPPPAAAPLAATPAAAPPAA